MSIYEGDAQMTHFEKSWKSFWLIKSNEKQIVFCGNDELFTCDGDYCGLSDELEMHTSNSSHHNVCVCVKKDINTGSAHSGSLSVKW